MMPKAARKPAKGVLVKPTTEVQIYEAVPSIVRRNGLFEDMETVSVLLGNCEALRKAVTVYKEAGPANGEFLLKRMSTGSMPHRTPKVRWADEVQTEQPKGGQQRAPITQSDAGSRRQGISQQSGLAEPEAAEKAAAARSCLRIEEPEVLAAAADPAETRAEEETAAVPAAHEITAPNAEPAAAELAAAAGADSIEGAKQQQECAFVHVQRTAAAADQEHATPSPESPAAVAVVTTSAPAPKAQLPTAAVAAAAATAVEGCQLTHEAAAAAAAEHPHALQLSINSGSITTRTGINSPDTPGSVALVNPALVAGHQEQLVAELKDRLLQLKGGMELQGVAHCSSSSSSRSSSSTDDEPAAEATAADLSAGNKQQQLLMANAMRLASLCKQLRAVEEAATLLQESAVHGGDGKPGWPKLQTAVRSCQRTNSLRLSCDTSMHTTTALSREGSSSSFQGTLHSPRHTHALHVSIPSFSSAATASAGSSNSSSSSSNVPAVGCLALSPTQSSSPMLETPDAQCSSNSSASSSFSSASTSSNAATVTYYSNSTCRPARLSEGAGDRKSRAGVAPAPAAAAVTPTSGYPVLRTAARVAARASRNSSAGTGHSPPHSTLSMAHIARRRVYMDAAPRARPAAAAVHSKSVGSWPVLNTAKRFEARLANCSVRSSTPLRAAATYSSAAARKGLKPHPAAAAPAAAAACRSPAVTEGGWPTLHTAARCCARGSSSCTMGGSAAPGAFGRMCDACRLRMQQQKKVAGCAEQQLLQQRCEQWQQQSAAVPAGFAVANSEPGAYLVRAESGAGTSRWHY